MPQQGFFNSNESRSYPFVAGTVGLPISGPVTVLNLPHPVIVDCGFVIGPHVDFLHTDHAVYLASIVRDGDDVSFNFETNCPGLLGIGLTFTRTLNDPKYVTEHGDSGLGGGAFCETPLWSGYLVTGDMAALAAFLSDDEVLGPGAEVEPTLIQSLSNAGLLAVGTGNEDRTRYTNPPGCEEIEWPYDVGTVFPDNECIGGSIVFKAGYNCTVRQAERENSITIGALISAGEGEPCGDEIPIYGSEMPPPGSQLLSGGPQCNEVLRSINGVGGPIVSLIAGDGVVITPVPGENRIKVTVSMAGLAVCFSANE